MQPRAFLHGVFLLISKHGPAAAYFAAVTGWAAQSSIYFSQYLLIMFAQCLKLCSTTKSPQIPGTRTCISARNPHKPVNKEAAKNFPAVIMQWEGG